MRIRALAHIQPRLRDSFDFDSTMQVVNSPLSWYELDHNGLQSHAFTLQARWTGMHETVAKLQADDASTAAESARKAIAAEQKATAEFRAFADRKVSEAAREGKAVTNPYGTGVDLGPHLSQLLQREDAMTAGEYAKLSTHYDNLGELLEISRSRLEFAQETFGPASAEAAQERGHFEGLLGYSGRLKQAVKAQATEHRQTQATEAEAAHLARIAELKTSLTADDQTRSAQQAELQRLETPGYPPHVLTDEAGRTIEIPA